MAPATPPSFRVEAQAELLGVFDGGDIGGGALVTHRPALVVNDGLGEHAAEFDFARVCRLAFHLTGAAFGFRLHYRHAGAIHFDAEDWDRGSADGG